VAPDHAGSQSSDSCPRPRWRLSTIACERSATLIGCDNNLPNTGRNPAVADDTELIVVKVPDSGRAELSFGRAEGLPGP
jgi:hypothetical protein